MNALGHRGPIAWSDRLLAASTHVLFAVGLIAAALGRKWPTAILLMPLLCSCVVALTSRDSRPFARDHARESINLQVSALLAVLAFAFLMVTTPDTMSAAIALFGGYVLMGFVQTCDAARHALTGREFRPPLALRFLH
jgi:uncharacterized Tic20 family protein